MEWETSPGKDLVRRATASKMASHSAATLACWEPQGIMGSRASHQGRKGREGLGTATKWKSDRIMAGQNHGETKNSIQAG
jgi:hypothetical protein